MKLHAAVAEGLIKFNVIESLQDNWSCINLWKIVSLFG